LGVRSIPDLVGLRFSHLIVIEYAGFRGWKCLCDCGKFVLSPNAGLLKGRAKSCGCARGEKHKKHGLCLTSEYKSWTGMIGRCYNAKSPNYSDYGARGIRVSPVWRHDFEKFLSDVGHRPSPKHSIDRYPDNNGDYKPGNVRWATSTQQNRNKRSNTNHTYNGITMTAHEWAKSLGLAKSDAIAWRLKNGWTLQEALTHGSWGMKHK